MKWTKQNWTKCIQVKETQFFFLSNALSFQLNALKKWISMENKGIFMPDDMTIEDAEREKKSVWQTIGAAGNVRWMNER